MEDSLQKVFSIIISVLIFFLLPIYIAFEKKDDISYSLALKVTSNFVDEVCEKGYMTIDMYNNLVSDLGATQNDFEILMEHNSKVYEPVIYGKKDGKQYTFDYKSTDKTNFDEINRTLKLGSETYTDVSVSYKVNDIRYYQDQMLDVMDQDSTKASEYIINKDNYDSITNISYIGPISGLYRDDNGKSIYPMNIGDTFNIAVKNTNITLASVLFNTLTFGARTGDDTKIYINYGGTVKNESYRKTVVDSDVTDTAQNIKEERTLNEIIQNINNETLGYLDELDMNDDKIIDGKDISCVYEYIKNGVENTAEYGKINKKKADVDYSGVINTIDLNKIIDAMILFYDYDDDGDLTDEDHNSLKGDKDKYDIDLDGAFKEDDINLIQEYLLYKSTCTDPEKIGKMDINKNEGQEGIINVLDQQSLYFAYLNIIDEIDLDGNSCIDDKDLNALKGIIDAVNKIRNANRVNVASISITNKTDFSKLDIADKSSIKLKVDVFPADASDPSLTYSSSDNTIVTVDENGNVSLPDDGKLGKATITVFSSNNKKDTVEVNVVKYIIKDGLFTGNSGGIHIRHGDTNGKSGYYNSDAGKTSYDNTNKCRVIKNESDGYRSYVATENLIDFTGINEITFESEIESKSISNKTSTWFTVSNKNEYVNKEVNSSGITNYIASGRKENINGECVYTAKRSNGDFNFVSLANQKGYVVMSFSHTGSLKIKNVYLGK